MPSYLHNLMLNAAKEIHTSSNGGSLLFVFGEHPLIRNWPVNGVFPDSSSLAHTTHGLRKSRSMSSRVEFCAVENSIVHLVDHLEKKTRVGAKIFIMQPPLLSNYFARWWDEASMRGLFDATKIIVGLPLIISARYFSLWLHLMQAPGKEAKVSLLEFQRAEVFESGKEVTKGTALLRKEESNNSVNVHDVILKVGLNQTMGKRFTTAHGLREALEDNKDIHESKGISLTQSKREPFRIPAAPLDLMHNSLRILALGDMTVVDEKSLPVVAPPLHVSPIQLSSGLGTRWPVLLLAKPFLVLTGFCKAGGNASV
eukprot:Gb_15484 [translate_table: standard]